MSRIHTPGPWREGKGGIGPPDVVVSDTPCRPQTPDNAGESEGEYYGGYLIAESIAPQNRPLISMAPELLEACEDVHTILGAAQQVHARATIDQLIVYSKVRLQYVLAELACRERKMMERGEEVPACTKP